MKTKKDILITTKRELKNILEDIDESIKDTTQFTINIEKWINYYHICEE